MELGIIAIGAALAIGLGALATGLAQARIGSAAVGAIAEKPELTVTGSPADLLGWLCGRRDGDGLTVDGGPLPTLPPL